MNLTVKSVTGPRWANADHTTIGCTVQFNEIPEALPFGARADDSMDYGRQLFADLVAGKYGAIAEYSPPA